MRRTIFRAAATALCLFAWLTAAAWAAAAWAASDSETDIEKIVAQTIEPAMHQYGIPGMAVGIVAGSHTAVANYGVASKATGKHVGSDTLFEIGSVSKTFTATLASYAQITGRLSLSDSPGKYLPSLLGSGFDTVSLLNLGTHTSGGLPLQAPDDVTNTDQLMRYFQSWKPAYSPGSSRTYSNLSIGLLGMIAAKSMNEDFGELMEHVLFPELGMKHTYLNVPGTEAANYAQGYTKADVAIRMAPGLLAPEAYGIRTTAADMVRFVEANIRPVGMQDDLQRAIIATHTGYYRIGPMTQDLIWEQYQYPVGLKDLLNGNSAKVSNEANPVIVIDPPLQPRIDVLLNKTGSTNGFASYVAFIPEKKLGLVLLANKNYPIDVRVTVALEILTRLDAETRRN